MAHELARHGVQCRLIDKAPGRSETSRAIGIHARTIETFDLMGVAQDFFQAGQPVRAISAFDGERQIGHITLNDLDTPYPFVLSLPQNDTERILEERVSHSNIQIERDTEITAVEQHGDAVSVRLRVAGRKIQDDRFDYLIGCDGAHSTVRQLLGLPFKGGGYIEVVLLADVRVQDKLNRLNRNEAQMFLAPDGLTLFLPTPDNRYRLIATGPAPNWGTEPTLEQCQSLMDSRGLNAFRLSDPIWTSTFHIHHRTVKHFRQARVFLAGDAAHIHSPMGAQGMNAGIQDAFNLAWKIGLVARQLASEQLLDSYEAERMPIDMGIVRATDRGTRLLFLKGKAAHQLHVKFVGFLTRFKWTRRLFTNNVSQIGANYRSSQIVEEHELSEGPSAGDRAPDAALRRADGEPDRLFILFGSGRHTLLLLWAPNVDFPFMNEMTQVKVYRIAGPGSSSADFIDSDGAVAAHYGIEPSAYLVRPDGYVAFRCGLQDLPVLFPRYLEKIFPFRAADRRDDTADACA